ncbi:MAG TPA: hypothetical protein DEQ50_02855 [Lactobacillus sp.]|uniref:Uncharacterized protein n=1 Tax=Companilactobacillus formosensis TaxID=1617889 RepID=A0A2P4R575_9LACO|nr:hypothetical protein [Lactobacillus sp.]
MKPIEVQIVSKASLILSRQKSPTKNNFMAETILAPFQISILAGIIGFKIFCNQIKIYIKIADDYNIKSH